MNGFDLETYLPEEIIGLGQHSMELIYQNGQTKQYSAQLLRQNCGCAFCVDELTGEKKKKISNLDDNLYITHIDLLGRYALQIQFSDGHKTGIFHLKKLYNGLAIQSNDTTSSHPVKT